MKLLADVKVSRRVVERLRVAGVEAVRVPEVMAARAADADIVAEAALRGAILVSHDQDFSAILAAGRAIGPSLVNLRVSTVDADRHGAVILAALAAAAEDLEAGAIVTVDDRGMRIHRLPIG